MQVSHNEDEAHEDMSDTPRYRNNQQTSGPASRSRKQNTTGRDVEVIDKSYRVRNKDYKTFFKVGRVFSTLWSEGMGHSGAGGATRNRDTFVTEIVFGERVHSTIRRFVVVRQDDLFCTCLPIHIHNPGSRKGNLNTGDHGLIYSQGRPEAIEGLTKSPIRVELVKSAQPLRDYSLVNYARTYTVETNVKVKDIGELDLRSKDVLRTNFRDVFIGPKDRNDPEITTTDRSSGTPVFDSSAGMHIDSSPVSPSSRSAFIFTDVEAPSTETQVSCNIQSDTQLVQEVLHFYPSSWDSNLSSTNLGETQGLPRQHDFRLHTQTPWEHQYIQQIPGFSVIGKPVRFFKVGRVFKTLWTEPAGATAKDADPNFYTRVSYNELVYSKFRRFVVIRERLHSCLCLPLYTYGGQGTTKSDVRAQDHAAVYAQGNSPPPLEENLEKEPFAIVVEEPSESIGSMSRINFAQVYTIQHNVKVIKVGRISKDQLERLNKYFVDSITST